MNSTTAKYFQTNSAMKTQSNSGCNESKLLFGTLNGIATVFSKSKQGG